MIRFRDTRAGLFCAAAVAVAVVSVGSPGADAVQPTAPDAAKVRLSDRLTNSPTIELSRGGREYSTPEAARAAAARTATAVPMPEGSNVNGIRWEEAGGSFTEADVQFLVQYNALCQWTRALDDGRDTATAETVRRATPRWSALRAVEAASALGRAVSDPASAEAAALRAECAASHVREVAWARERGLPPTG